KTAAGGEAGGGRGAGPGGGAYSIQSGSPAATGGTPTGAPNHDFFGTPRGSSIGIGAVQFVGTVAPPPTIPTLTVLDSFNRANANNLGGNWSQAIASIRVDTNQAFCTGLLCALGGAAYFNNPTTGYGSRQAAALTIGNGTLT